MARSAALALALVLAAGPAVAGAPRSGVRLLGTVVSSDAAHSLAMVDEGGLRPRTVRVGNELAGATVVEIRSESVVLERRGERETLVLASQSRPSESSARAGDVPASPAGSEAELDSRADRPRRGAATASARRSAPAARHGAPARPAPPPGSEAATARSADEMLADLSSQARFAAVNDDNGKLRGVAVMNVLGDSALERLGLRSDDVVTSINGTPIDSSGAALTVAGGLSPRSTVTLGIERRGVPQVLRVDLRNLQR